MRAQAGAQHVAALILALAALAGVALVSTARLGATQEPHRSELISADDRALLNPLYMMKQLAAINKWAEPRSERPIPERAVLEAQVAAKQQAAQDKTTLEQEAHTEAREGRHAPPKRAVAAPFTDAKVDAYEKQATVLAAESKQHSETASELAAKAQALAAEAKKQERWAKRANAKGETMIHTADTQSRRLKQQAHVEDEQASHLVVFAKKLAQRMVKEEAMDEIKKWMAANAAKRAAKPRRPESRHAEHKVSRVRRGHRSLQAAHERAGTRRRLPTTALRAKRAVRPAPKPATEGSKIRDEFQSWRAAKLKTYATEHDLYTKTQFCNSRDTAHSPSIAELQRAFGADWQDVPPRVASLAAVDGCMQALGLRAKDASTPDVWDKGPLKGKAAEVRSCAHGDNQVCPLPRCRECAHAQQCVCSVVCACAGLALPLVVC
jgi:hypothetical protein